MFRIQVKEYLYTLYKVKKKLFHFISSTIKKLSHLLVYLWSRGIFDSYMDYLEDSFCGSQSREDSTVALDCSSSCPAEEEMPQDYAARVCHQQ